MPINQNKNHIEREFEFTNVDFNDISARLTKLSGIVLRDNKHDMVYGRLARRLRILNFNDFGQYRAYLDTTEGTAKETQHFVNALTTNLTSFFREEHHFDHLHKHIGKVMESNPKKSLRLWCSATSTGQEPYSISMTLDSLNLSSRSNDIKLLCTDLDTNVLQTAEQGIYENSAVDKLPVSKRNQYFKSQPDGMFKIDAKLKEIMMFRQLNLLSSWPMKGPFDVIFCRNVLIYFDQPTRVAIVSKMLSLLPVGGILYLGHSEAFPLSSDLVASEGHTIFRKL
ncbi:MAG: chemotaxis protein methyltransferase CheR [Alphaproteobacteria bacterium]|jgi:chemotaxis protein methyltransferase CheR